MKWWSLKWFSSICKFGSFKSPFASITSLSELYFRFRRFMMFVQMRSTSREVWWIFWIGSFWPKLEVFYRPDWTKGRTRWKNEMQKWMLQTVRKKKVPQTPINHVIFWKSVMRTFRCIYVNCFNRLRFLAEVSSKFKKILFFGEFKDHNSGTKHINQTIDPIFFMDFFGLAVCNIHFCVSFFHVVSFPLWSILVCKISQFWAKATDSNSPSYFFTK